MKRTTMGAVLAAGALLLAGCGSTGGNATAGTAVAPTTAGSETMAPTTETSMDVPTTDESTTEESTADESTTEESTTEESTTEESTASGNTGSEDTTAGGTGNIDATTTEWFDTFCTSLAPVADLSKVQSQIDPSDPQGSLKIISDALIKVGDAYNDGATKLESTPAPTFTGGEAFAAKMTKAFADLGPKMTKLGEKFADIDPTDPSAKSEVLGMYTDVQEAAKPLQELASAPTPVLMALGTVPSCRALAG